MKKAAIVRFIDNPKKYAFGEKELTNGKYYNAFFTEYNGLKRNNVWILTNEGKPNYFYDLDDFQIIEDVNHVLDNKTACVKCLKNAVGLTINKKYKALGRHNDCYLIYDDFLNSTLFKQNLFEIIEDNDNILLNDVYNFDNYELNDLSAYINNPVEILCHCERKKGHDQNR